MGTASVPVSVRFAGFGSFVLAVHAVLPGQFQLRYVLGVNLRHRRIALPFLIVAIRRPIVLPIRHRRSGHRRKKCARKQSHQSPLREIAA